MLTSGTVKNIIVTLYSLVEVYWRFGETYCPQSSGSKRKRKSAIKQESLFASFLFQVAWLLAYPSTLKKEALCSSDPASRPTSKYFSFVAVWYQSVFITTFPSWYSDELWAELTRFDSRQGQDRFLYSAVSKPALGPSQPSVWWVPATLSLEIKRSGREADHSPPSSSEVKNNGAIITIFIRHNTTNWK
jgi:hypothetical protein